MPGEFDTSIDQSQAEIQKSGLHEKGDTYPQIFQHSVDNFQTKYADAFKSPEGQAKLEEGKQKISQLLLEIASRGATLAYPESANHLANYAAGVSHTINRYVTELDSIKGFESKVETATNKIKELDGLDVVSTILSLNTNESAGTKLQNIALKSAENIVSLGEVIRMMSESKNLPETLVQRLQTETEQALMKVQKMKVAAETAMLAQKHSNFVRFTVEQNPYVKVTIVPHPNLKLVSQKLWEGMSDEEKQKHQPCMTPREYETMIATLAMPSMAVAEEVEMATAPKFLENFWAAKKLFDVGALSESQALCEKFLTQDLASPEWEKNPIQLAKKNEYEQLARKMLEKIKENSDNNKEFFVAQNELAGGNIYAAKTHLKTYLQAANTASEEDKPKYSFANLAKELLKIIVLTQVKQVRERMERAKPPQYTMVADKEKFVEDKKGPQALKQVETEAYKKYQFYEMILRNTETGAQSGQVTDFNDALKTLPQDQTAAINDSSSKFNFITNEILENDAEEKEADPDKRGLKNRKETYLLLAQKYRSEGNYQMAEEYFNKYFSKYFAKMMENKEVNLQTLWAEHSKHPRILLNIEENVKKAEFEWQKNSREKGPEWAMKNPWDREKVYAAYRDESMCRLRPLALQKAQQRKFMLDPNVMSMDDQEAWKQFANMKGVHGTDKWYEPLALSDEQADELTKELPIQIGIIAISGGIGSLAGAAGAGVGRRIAAGIVRRGAVAATEEIAEWGVVSGAERLGAWAGGLVFENTAFTASNTVINTLRTGQFGTAEQFMEEWATGAVTLGGLGMVGRASHAMNFGKVTAFGTEVAGMANIDIANAAVMKGEFERPDLLHTCAMVLGLKAGHAIPGMLKGPFGGKASEITPGKVTETSTPKTDTKIQKPGEAKPEAPNKTQKTPAATAEGHPESATKTHRTSEFRSEMPEGIGQDANGAITVDGKVVMNLDRINKILEKNTSGKYRATPEGIIGPDGKLMSTKQYLEKFAGRPEAKQLLDAIKQVKTHEVHHRVIEALKGEKIGDSTFGEELVKLVKENPELAKLVGEPVTFEKVQELISEMQDGSGKHEKVSAESRQQVQKTLERLFGALGYKYNDKTSISIRKIDTKLLGKKPAEDFKRSEAAPSEGPMAGLHEGGKPPAPGDRIPEGKPYAGWYIQYILDGKAYVGRNHPSDRSVAGFAREAYAVPLSELVPEVPRKPFIPMVGQEHFVIDPNGNPLKVKIEPVDQNTGWAIVSYELSGGNYYTGMDALQAAVVQAEGPVQAGTLRVGQERYILGQGGSRVKIRIGAPDQATGHIPVTYLKVEFAYPNMAELGKAIEQARARMTPVEQQPVQPHPVEPKPTETHEAQKTPQIGERIASGEHEGWFVFKVEGDKVVLSKYDLKSPEIFKKGMVTKVVELSELYSQKTEAKEEKKGPKVGDKVTDGNFVGWFIYKIENGKVTLGPYHPQDPKRLSKALNFHEVDISEIHSTETVSAPRPAPKPEPLPPPRPAPRPAPEPADLDSKVRKQAGYTISEGADRQLFEARIKAEMGRDVINSDSDTIDGKVYMAEGVEKSMEAIVVDTAKDPVLNQFIEDMIAEVDKAFNPNIFSRYIMGKSPISPEAVFRMISLKIANDFPYAHNMTDDAYQQAKYKPSQKVYLGVIMKNQDMVCRHMALLAKVTAEKIMSHPKFAGRFPEGTTARFYADQQSSNDPKERRNGHAYMIMAMPTPEGGMKYMVSDPTYNNDPTRAFRDLGEIIDSGNLTSTARTRYVFSLLRMVLKRNSPMDDGIIGKIVEAGKTNPQFEQIQRDAIKQDMAGGMRLNSARVKAGLPMIF